VVILNYYYFPCVEHDDSTVLGVVRTSTIISGGCSLLLLLLLCGVYFYDLPLVFVLFYHYYFLCCQARWLNHLGSGSYFYNHQRWLFSTTTTITLWHVLLWFTSGDHSLLSLLLSVLSSTMTWPSREWCILLRFTSGGHSLLSLLFSMCRARWLDRPGRGKDFYNHFLWSFSTTSTFHVLSIFLIVTCTSMITFGGCSPLLLSLCWAQWLHLPGSDVYFYDHLWWLFSTTTILLLLSVCRARCLDFYNHFLLLFSTTSTFRVLGIMIPPSSEWCVLLWPPLVIILHYYYFPCVGHKDSTVLRMVCTSMITTGDYSPLLLLSMCQPWCLNSGTYLYNSHFMIVLSSWR